MTSKDIDLIKAMLLKSINKLSKIIYLCKRILNLSVPIKT